MIIDQSRHTMSQTIHLFMMFMTNRKHVQNLHSLEETI